MRFVLDAGVALVWFLRDEDPEIVRYAAGVLETVEQRSAQAVVPWMWHHEVAAVLLRRRRAHKLSIEAFEAALEVLGAMSIETHQQAYDVITIVERAQRYGVQVGDALYFDLASSLGLPIATVDRGLRSAARAHGVRLVTPAPG